MSHLDYYIKYNIAPVSYDLSDLSAHFQRREALYRTLGVLPLTFRSAQVLEVAAGTGHNSLYVASLAPQAYTLLEPNPAGIRAIKECYAGAAFTHTSPILIESKLEDYAPEIPFDIVLCENWLGSSAHERGLLRKLAGFVATRGILVVTCISPIGFLPNVIRRALAARLTDVDMNFEARTAVLVEAFGPHLRSILGMTRSVRDWVQDNMLNPAYFDLCLTLPMLVDELGATFQIAGVSPDFRRDWRWFKSLSCEAHEFNHATLAEYARAGAAFLDYRSQPADLSPDHGRELERQSLILVEEVRALESVLAGGGDHVAALRPVIARLQALRVGFETAGIAPALGGALNEAADLLAAPALSPSLISAMKEFAGWFGRETLYVALERSAWHAGYGEGR